MKTAAARGYTLIELMIALAIGSILLVLAAPFYGEWVADAQVKSAAESVASGLRFALAEAVKRNTSVEMVLDPTTKTGGWIVQLPDGTLIQSATFEEGANGASFAVAPGGATKVTFTGLGMVGANTPASATIESVDITAPVAVRPLRVLVPVNTATGRRSGIKICDPNFAATDPKGCPVVIP